MFTLFKKEINDYMNTLSGYIVMVVFLVILGLLLWGFPLLNLILPKEFNILWNGYAEPEGFFLIAPVLFLILIPAFTMRSFAEEKRAGTLELLLTQPVSDLQVIMAKFLAGTGVVVMALIPTLVYLFSIWFLSLEGYDPDWGRMWISYAGLILVGAALTSIGIFASAVSGNQITALLLSVTLSFLIYIGLDTVHNYLIPGKIGLFLQNLGIHEHYISIRRGVLDTRDLIYFISVTALFLLLTKWKLESRKWSLKRNNILPFVLSLFIIALINVIGAYLFLRVDFTAEKRYSLSPATKQMLKELDDEVFFRVYLDGEELPPGFRRLSNETKEMLNEFRAYSDRINYEFINPSASANARERNDTYKLLAEQGLQPTDLRVNKKGESSQLIIFPGAMVVYKGRELPVQLLMSQFGQDPQVVLNNSIQALEFNLGNAVDKLVHTTKPMVAVLQGEGELSPGETAYMEQALSEYYNLERISIDGKINSLTLRLKTDSSGTPLINKYKALIIAGPEKRFSDKDKFLIDQFIMRGGRVLWMIDPVLAKMDSLRQSGSTIGLSRDLNLDDILFAYGVRLNQNLVMDMKALPIPIKTGQVGEQPRFDFFPWYFFPLVTPANNHPIVNGLNAIKTEFVSSIDTVEAPGVTKTVLLTSSPYSRVVNAPALIDLEILRDEPDPRMFNGGKQPVAMLLEGGFTSAYLFRIPPELELNDDLDFRKKSKPTRMVVIADGDIGKNQFHVTQGYPLPLGFDQYTGETFGNKDLLLNIMNYLCDDSGLISVRSRELKMRLLDPAKVNNHEVFWQSLNVLLPVILIVLFGFIKFFLRKKTYATVS